MQKKKILIFIAVLSIGILSFYGFKNAAKKAGIVKTGTSHMLRHSFATDPLENNFA